MNATILIILGGLAILSLMMLLKNEVMQISDALESATLNLFDRVLGGTKRHSVKGKHYKENIKRENPNVEAIGTVHKRRSRRVQNREVSNNDKSRVYVSKTKINRIENAKRIEEEKKLLAFRKAYELDNAKFSIYKQIRDVIENMDYVLGHELTTTVYKNSPLLVPEQVTFEMKSVPSVYIDNNKIIRKSFEEGIPDEDITSFICSKALKNKSIAAEDFRVFKVCDNQKFLTKVRAKLLDRDNESVGDIFVKLTDFADSSLLYEELDICGVLTKRIFNRDEIELELSDNTIVGNSLTLSF